MRDVDVLIVGGGPVGLTASILLSRAGVTSLLVERHPGTALHPKARGINARTMEIYRQCGVEDAIRAAGLAARALALHRLGALAGRRGAGAPRAGALARRGAGDQPGAPLPLRPGRSGAGAARRTRSRSRPGVVEFGAELLTFAQDADGVTATVRTRDGETHVRARYLIAADGARSRVREALGIPMHGNAGALSQHQRAAQRRSHALGGRPAGRALLHRAAGAEGDVPHDQRRQPLGLPDQQPAAERLGRRVHAGALRGRRAPGGRRARISTSRSSARSRGWRPPRWPSATVAAASSWPATRRTTCRRPEASVSTPACRTSTISPGSWPRVLHGWAGARAARFLRSRATALWPRDHRAGPGQRPLAGPGRVARRRRRRAALARPEFLNELGMIFGARYESDAVVADGTPPPKVANPVTDYTPTARPGSRAPHVWVERDGSRVSTLDLLGGQQFTLLAGPDGRAWCRRGSRRRRSSRACRSMLSRSPRTNSRPAETADWTATYGIEDDGAVLIRPDGYVGWRRGLGLVRSVRSSSPERSSTSSAERNSPRPDLRRRRDYHQIGNGRATGRPLTEHEAAIPIERTLPCGRQTPAPRCRHRGPPRCRPRAESRPS